METISECEYDGCDRPAARTRRHCSTHYMRWIRYGDMSYSPLKPRMDRRLHSAGYVIVSRPTHPLADGGGYVYEHRQVLFDVIGYGPHLCHWCGVVVNWQAGLEVDHVDADKANNLPTNLVQACHRCNTRRAHGLGAAP